MHLKRQIFSNFTTEVLIYTPNRNLILMKLNITDILMAPQIISQASLLSYYLEDLIVYLMHLLEHLTDIPNLT